MLGVPSRGALMGCRESPARECFAWHVIPKCQGVKYRKRADGTDDLYSVRMLCPAHDDTEASLGMSLDGSQLKYHCFACQDTAKVRLALIRVYGIEPRCLPLPPKEKQDILNLLEQILTADTADHAGIRLRALAALEGYADLPGGAELARIAVRASVGLASAYRAKKSPPPVTTANPGSYPPEEKAVKQRRSERRAGLSP